MDIELINRLSGSRLVAWKDLLTKAGLHTDFTYDRTVLVWDNGLLIAAASRQENILKGIAVDDSHRGEDLTATLLTQLRQDAFEAGYSHLFLYTKPQNLYMFRSLFFYPVAQTKDVLLMENKENGISQFLDTLPAAPCEGTVGAAVMNCNPFTKGHQYLIETAAKECDRLYVFVLSEDKGEFSFRDRLEMVKLGTTHLPNVTVLPTGPYLISSATFPTYFLKDRENVQTVQCQLDIEIFSKFYAPKFGITRRYVGTEPLSPMTNLYNEALKEYLPANGIELIEIPRLEQSGAPVSASRVRQLLQDKDMDTLHDLVPATTYDYLTKEA